MSPLERAAAALAILCNHFNPETPPITRAEFDAATAHISVIDTQLKADETASDAERGTISNLTTQVSDMTADEEKFASTFEALTAPPVVQGAVAPATPSDPTPAPVAVVVQPEDHPDKTVTTPVIVTTDANDEVQQTPVVVGIVQPGSITVDPVSGIPSAPDLTLGDTVAAHPELDHPADVVADDPAANVAVVAPAT